MHGLSEQPDEQLLADAGLIVGGGITYAALILLGTADALGRRLAQSEVVFEYRSTDTSVSAQQRMNYREGLFLFHDDLWKAINARNDNHHYQDGLFVRDIPSFNERVVREAILNAITHRDYRSPGKSVFIRQSPRKLEVVSPGGFPPTITPENILWNTEWRNRRVAEVLEKCHLVERSGQGADMMFAECIREGKATPDFSGSDNNQVSLTLDGQVQDVRFLKFLEDVGRKKLASFSVEDLLVLDCLHRERPVPERVKARIPYLKDQGIIETLGRGRGTRHILSRRLYDLLGKSGVYTRRRGLDREANKALLLQHILRYGDKGSTHQAFAQALPGLTRNQIKSLLCELQGEGKVFHTGRTKGSRWYPAQKPE